MTRQISMNTNEPYFIESPNHINGFENESIAKHLEEIIKDFYLITNSEFDEPNDLNGSDICINKSLCHMISKN